MERFIILVKEVNVNDIPVVITDIVLDFNYINGFTTHTSCNLLEAKKFDNESALKMVKQDFGKNYKVIKIML